ncbi:MAG: DNA-directed RNA polymerase subunit A' [Promethearchaeota archaeon]
MAYNIETFKIIEKIRFGLLSPEEIRKMSVGRIITADTYDEDGLPIKSGLMDPKLGTIEPGQKCSTCGNRVGACPGHFGHIELARPVIHVGHSKLLLKILRSICTDCGRVLLTPDQIEDFKVKQERFIKIFDKPDETLFAEIFKTARKAKECPYCGAIKKKLIIEKPTTFYEDAERLTPVDVRAHLEKMGSADCNLIGINTEAARPEWMILTVLPIPPVCVRPSITLDSGIRSEDDLTHKLVDVIRINQRLRENIDAGAPQLIVEDLWELLQYHITTYFNNEVSGIPPARHRSGRALRTLSQRLKGKEGRFRSNLSGKRVDFSARTVISPSPHISLNEVGVPYKIAKILTVPSFVTEFNIEDMKQCVLNGPKKHPGANYIIREDGRRIDLRFVKNREIVASMIKPGFVIERHLRDGDLVLFNRQPSLHRMSIMAHHVRVMPGQTFRLALVVCPPYNADFDGDEMNLHVPQSEEARTEAEYLLKVQEHIVSPRYGAPIIGAIQDFISVGYMFTRNEKAPGIPNVFSRKDTYSLLYWGNVFKHNPTFKIDQLDPVNPEDPSELWKFTGKSIFSCVLPHDLNMDLKSKFYRKDLSDSENSDGHVRIVNGKMISGVIDKNLMGDGKATSVLHRIIRDYGPNRGREFLDDFVGMMVWVITLTGLTMGIDEVDVGPARKMIHNAIYKSYDESQRLIKAYYDEDEEILPCAPGRTLYETLELNLMGLLNKVRGEAGDIASEYLGDIAHSVIMTKSGARGNPLNLAQMAACVGQQSVRQERIHRGYINRTLPHFKVDDLSPQSRGFVLNSYRTGLTPTEFFFHAMGGREGLVDTAVRTSSSGYMQRRLVNALQDMVVQNDLSVRTSEKSIIQFKYGDDGVDPGRSDAGVIIDFDQAVLKTRRFKDLMTKEKNISEMLEGKSHPEFSVDYIKNKSNEEIPESLSDTSSKKPSVVKKEVKPKPPKIEEESEVISEEDIEEVVSLDDLKAKPFKSLSKDEKYLYYHLEMGKNAIVRGKQSGIYKNWVKDKKKTISQPEVANEIAKEEILKSSKKKINEVPEPEIDKEELSLEDFQSKSFNSLSIEEKHNYYNLETGKKAIVRGRVTKIFKEWSKEKKE